MGEVLYTTQLNWHMENNKQLHWDVFISELYIFKETYILTDHKLVFC